MVLKTVLLVRIEAGHCNPPASVRIIAVHTALVIIGERPVIEVTHDVRIIPMFSSGILVMKDKCYLVSFCIDAIPAT